jgi:CheY-like chemotaxis protein
VPHTLLLADDSLAIQRVVELTFASEDVRVVAVGDGQQAIDRLTSDRPDIVLADIAMPLADGYAVAEFVRSNPAIRDIPVLLLAGAFDIVEESRLSASGARGILVKPFEPHVVINRVKELLGLTPSGGESTPPPDGSRLVTPPETPRPARTLNADPPFWREPSTNVPPPSPVGPVAESAAELPRESAATPPAESIATVGEPPAIAVAPTEPAPLVPVDAISSELVDRIAAKVVEQLGERLRGEVTEVVLDVSERLVREEIARIRAAAERDDS